jgi:hypothetical protein
MEFLACPAYLNHDGSVRCGLPAEVTCRFTMHSSDGPLESVMMQCPARHHFNAPVEFLTFEDGPSPSRTGTSGALARDTAAIPAQPAGPASTRWPTVLPLLTTEAILRTPTRLSPHPRSGPLRDLAADASVRRPGRAIPRGIAATCLRGRSRRRSSPHRL